MDQVANGDKARTSLRKVFARTDCHTLPAPVSSVSQWTELPNLAATELAHGYLASLDDLGKKLSSTILSSRATLRTGKEIATLVRVLVEKINSGSLASVPSTFQLLLKQQVAEAREAAEAAHESSSKDCLIKPPLETEEATSCCDRSATNATKLFRNL